MNRNQQHEGKKQLDLILKRIEQTEARVKDLSNRQTIVQITNAILNTPVAAPDVVTHLKLVGVPEIPKEKLIRRFEAMLETITTFADMMGTTKLLALRAILEYCLSKDEDHRGLIKFVLEALPMLGLFTNLTLQGLALTSGKRMQLLAELMILPKGQKEPTTKTNSSEDSQLINNANSSGKTSSSQHDDSVATGQKMLTLFGILHIHISHILSMMGDITKLTKMIKRVLKPETTSELPTVTSTAVAGLQRFWYGKSQEDVQLYSLIDALTRLDEYTLQLIYGCIVFGAASNMDADIARQMYPDWDFDRIDTARYMRLPRDSQGAREWYDRMDEYKNGARRPNGKKKRDDDTVPHPVIQVLQLFDLYRPFHKATQNHIGNSLSEGSGMSSQTHFRT